MSKPGNIFIGLLAVLAGCSTAPQTRAPDWHYTEGNGEMEIQRVPDEPHLATPPATVPAIVAQPHSNSYAAIWIPLGRWSRENHIGTLRRTAQVPLPTFTLTTSNDVFVIQTKSLVAKWNGLEFHLGFEPQLIDDQPFVHVLDLKKNIEPLLQRFALPEKANRVVVIDAGHGGPNTGTSNILTHVYEKEYTLDWARRLEPLLGANGWQVFLTRTNDADLTLSDRIAVADEHKADLFISLHFNSPGEQAGVETYCVTPTGMPSTLKRDFDDNVSLVYSNNSFDRENLQLAMRLHEALLRFSGSADHGVRRARFMSVLRGQNRPAVLIEGGFLSNPREARRIGDPAYRQKLAEAVAQALVDNPESESSVQATNTQTSNSTANNPPEH